MSRSTSTTVSVVTTIGKVYKQYNMLGLGSAPIVTMVLGSSIVCNDAAAADTAMGTEIVGNGLDKVVLTTGQGGEVSQDAAGKITWTHTFTATGSATVAEIGILTANGALYLHSTLGSSVPISLVAGDTFKVTVTDQE